MLPLVFSPAYVTPLPDGHRFPMPKFGILRDLLIERGIAAASQFNEPARASRELLGLVHDHGYIDAFCDGTLDTQAIRRIGLPWSAELVKRTRTAVGGTLLTCELALQHGLACNVAGGTHHAHRGFGSGFCIFNDMAVAAAALLDRGAVDQVLIVDLDVHHGDGTATIFADDPRVFTFSMHCDQNFPRLKPPSDLDVPLPRGVGDAEYLDTLTKHLPWLLEQVEPDLVIYGAGVDVHRDDRLGYLDLTDQGLYDRDRCVIEQCRSHGIPTATVIGGGYDKNHEQLAWRHATVHRAARDLFNGESHSIPVGWRRGLRSIQIRLPRPR